MNQRLEAIDKVAFLLHGDRLRRDREHGGHGGSTPCVECRDMATFIVDEIAPVLQGVGS